MPTNRYNAPPRIQRKSIGLYFLIAITLFIAGGLHHVPACQAFQKRPTGVKGNAGVEDSAKVFNAPLVLCYHQVRDWKTRDSRNARTYIVPADAFRKQMKMLYENGYHTVLPDQWTAGKSLPNKPFILTFDDGTESQYINALPELERYGFKAVFFIMTVTLGKPDFMSGKQVRFLSDNGHLIGCHTWDHHDVKTYSEADWLTQLERPTLMLEQITGKPVHQFAYPFGSWDTVAIRHLKSQGYVAAYQLAGRAAQDNPSFTIRRMIVDGHWSESRLLTEIILFETHNHTRP